MLVWLILVDTLAELRLTWVDHTRNHYPNAYNGWVYSRSFGGSSYRCFRLLWHSEGVT